MLMMIIQEITRSRKKYLNFLIITMTTFGGLDKIYKINIQKTVLAITIVI